MKTYTNEEQQKYLEAKQQVQEIKGFYTHLAIYIVIMCLIITINLIYSPHYLWFLWTLFGWGFGVTMHGFKAFNYKSPIFGKDWEDKKIKEIIEKNRNHEQYE